MNGPIGCSKKDTDNKAVFSGQFPAKPEKNFYILLFFEKKSSKKFDLRKNIFFL